MAKQMSYEAADGAVHEASYWTLAAVHLNKLDLTGRLEFAGFKDKDAATAPRKAAIGAKTYDIPLADFVLYFAGAVAGNGALLTKCYQLATERLDTNGLSFFNGATDV